MKFILALLLLSFSLIANNLHLIDSDSNGFAIYRTSKPKQKDMREFCKLGIEEMVVLSGNAQSYEYKYQDECPGLKVVYNEKQSARIPLTSSFLEWFDDWVAEAQRTGKKIAFRCNCGCHRTGRLAAYYQMKYQNLTAADARILMKKHGKYMFLFKFLYPQVYALEDYIKEESCGESSRYCVSAN